MTDLPTFPDDGGDVPLVPPVASLVTVTGPGLSGPTAGIVTGRVDGEDGAVTVTLFPCSGGWLRRSPVFPAGYPGDGYRYDVPDWPEALEESPGLAGPDGDPAAAPAP